MGNIRRFINQNSKLIWRITGIVICVFLLIKLLNSAYEKDEEKKKNEIVENKPNNVVQTITKKDYTTQSNSIKITMASFVNYCNNKEIEKAYQMLTDDCKKAMFPTAEDFKSIYIDNIYNITRTYDMEKWLTNGNKVTYLVTLYEDILATGNTGKLTQEYYTFIKDDKGIYKLNINNYIYNKNRNLKTTVNNIIVQIENIDIYEDYEEAQITITNKKSKSICLNGNKYRDNIYLENLKGVRYSSLNSEFEHEEIILEPNRSLTFNVEFNKVYDTTNEASYLIISDIILDYDEYLKSENKSNYENRTSIKVNY